MKKTITKEFKFDSAHQLCNEDLSNKENCDVFGKCYNVHGHTYHLFVTVSGMEENGMIINFNELRRIVEENVINKFDHKFLNDTPEMKGMITTCENQIEIIWDLLEEDLFNLGVQLEELKLYETETSYATLSK
jgi:6-pyruvoyltetrahydropterin/6-carboxytetrahydropterin synthase